MKAKNEVVLFGAGASYGARDPHPPMGRELHCYVRQYLHKACGELGYLEDGVGTVATDVRRRLGELLDQSTSFESLVSEIRRREEKDSLLAKLNWLMASALTPPIHDDPRVDNAFAEKPDMYDCFLAANFPKGQGLENISFITLNYDCLLERAICRHTLKPLQGEQKCLCKHVNYHLGGECAAVEVLKPHGSINWVADITLGDGRISANRPVPMAGRLGLDDVWRWNKVDAVDSPIGQGHGEIVLAHYSPSKKPQINPGTLSKIRRIACDRISKAKLVTIIGLHVPIDPSEDPFLSMVLEGMKHTVHAGRTRVFFVNPDPKEIEKAESDLGFNVFQGTFDDYVNRLRAKSHHKPRRLCQPIPLGSAARKVIPRS